MSDSMEDAGFVQLKCSNCGSPMDIEHTRVEELKDEGWFMLIVTDDPTVTCKNCGTQYIPGTKYQHHDDAIYHVSIGQAQGVVIGERTTVVMNFSSGAWPPTGALLQGKAA